MVIRNFISPAGKVRIVIQLADEMTFWRPKVSDPEVFEFTDRVELKAEIELLKKTGLNFPIGIPDDFMYDEVAIDFIKIREHND